MKVAIEKKLVPELRFNEFVGTWNKEKLGNLVTIKSGNSPSSYELSSKGKHPFIKVEELNNCEKYQVDSRFYSDSVKGLVLENSVLFPKRGAAILNNKVRISYVPLLMDSNMMALECDSNSLYFEFLFYKIIKEKLYKIADTSTIPQLNNKHIHPYKLYIPNIEEQQKIASFLSKVDEKITLLTKKKELLEEYKKGVTQKIFKQEIRFKILNETGELVEPPKWAKRKLGDYLEHKSKRNKQLIVETILSVSNSKGFILQSDQFENHRIASKDVSNYKIVHKNDVAYNPSRINVGSIAILKDFDVGIISPMYVVFSLKNGLELSFFESLIETHLFKHLVKVGCSGSVRDSLNFEDLENFKLSLPKVEEQQKIASFISSIDKKISAVDQQLSLAKEWKKGLLQKMFV